MSTKKPEEAPRVLNEYRISRTAFVMIRRDPTQPDAFEPYKYLGATIPGRIHLMHMKEGTPFLRADEKGEIGLITQLGWDEMSADGDLKVVEPPSKISSRMLARTADWDTRDILGRPEGEKPAHGEDLPLEPGALKMLTEVLLLDENDVPNGKKAMTAAMERLWVGAYLERFGPHDNIDTIRGWRSTRGSKGDRRLIDFVRMWGRVPRGAYKDGVVHEVVQIMCLRAWTEEGSVVDVMAEVGTTLNEINLGLHPHHPKPDEPYACPHYNTVWRAYAALRNSFTTAARDGKAVMRADWLGAGRPMVAKRSLELAIADHTRLPISAVLDLDHDIVITTIWLSVLIDVSSRAVLSWVLTSFDPSYWTVAELIRRANRPKRPPADMAARYPGLRRICGRSDEIVVDNGEEFRSKSFESACAGAGFSVRFCPIKKPTYKAVGERFFRTIEERVCRRLPGYHFPIAEMRRREADASIDAVATLDDLEAITNQAIAEYHTDIHGSTNKQPLLAFEQGTDGFIDIAHDLDTFDNEIMEIIPELQIDMAGVTQWGMRYFHSTRVLDLLNDLSCTEPASQLRQDATATSKGKFDRINIGRIKVWNGRTRKYVVLQCEHASYADGMPLALHEQIVAQAEAEAAAFNTEEERMAARTRRIDAIRNIDKDRKAEQVEALKDLLENPRIRRITGNIVENTLLRPVAVTIGDFIPHDNASLTSVDAEILAPRKSKADEGRTKKRRAPARDRRDAGQSHSAPAGNPVQPATAARRLRNGVSRRARGDSN